MDEWLELAEMAGRDRREGLHFPVPVGRMSNGDSLPKTRMKGSACWGSGFWNSPISTHRG